MRIYLVVLCLPLSGCFAYIPGSVFDSANTCVGEHAYVGQRICNKDNGKCGRLKELSGRSERCQDGAIPIKATVEYD